MLFQSLFSILLSFICTAQAYTPGDECLVCLTRIEPVQYTHRFACAHIDIHVSCVNDWIEYRRMDASCPVCRAPMLGPQATTVSMLRQLITVSNSSCSTDPEILVLSHSLALSILNSGHTREFFEVLDICTFPLWNHLAFIKKEAQLGYWGVFDRHLRSMVIVDFRSVEYAFKLAARSGKVMIMTTILLHSTPHLKIITHVACIQQRNWACSDVFLRYYFGREDEYDVGKTLVEASFQRMPLKKYRAYFVLDETFISATDLERSLLVTSRLADWERFDLLWDFFVKRKAYAAEGMLLNYILLRVVMKGSDQLLQQVLLFPQFRRSDIAYCVASVQDKVKESDELALYDAKVVMLHSYVFL